MHRGFLQAATLCAALLFASCGRGEETQTAGVAQPAGSASPSPTAAAPASSIQHGLPDRPAVNSVWLGGRVNDASAPTPAPQTAPAETARRVSIEEALAASERSQAVFVDVRAADAYQQGHIRGALLMPESEIAQRAKELPRNKLIITYCA